MEEKTKSQDPNFRSFWDGTGESMPAFIDAPSTKYYFECERTLFESFFSRLEGKKIFKTDLWDEAKNTRILKWAADQGAEVYGLDISFPVVKDTQALFRGSSSKCGIIVSDLRQIAYRDESFDYIYSMGTIEHFKEYRQALEEIYRVLKKGGRAIIGVPNRWDPFLRPVMVTFLYWLNLYGYGYEKSFSMRALERMVRDAGFEILARSGILFMPGSLRMLDLFVHVKWPQASYFFTPLIRPFSFLYRAFPSLRRHGYLIASIVQKPQ
ncbi:MAG: class I SAM-dependent methyltransferase [Candidatus Aminicenantes bacterium]|jgi:SAM-dependent methyltransferase